MGNRHQADYDPHKWYIGTGTVQNYISRETPHAMIFFGRSEYDRDKPVLSSSLKEQGQAVCDALNTGQIDEAEARARLKKVYF